MEVLAYLIRRKTELADGTTVPEADPIPLAEWLAIAAADGSLRPRPDVECGCVEWDGEGTGGPAPSRRKARRRFKGRTLIFLRRGVLVARAAKPGLANKLVAIAAKLREGGRRDGAEYYLGVRLREGGRRDGLSTRLGPYLRAVISTSNRSALTNEGVADEDATSGLIGPAGLPPPSPRRIRSAVAGRGR